MLDETPRLGLPLMQAAQAHKHVTVNEALVRLDALVNAAVLSFGSRTPPADALDGDAHVVGPDAEDDWSGQDGAIAFRINGGWRFARPASGQRIWLRPESRAMLFDGAGWIAADGARRSEQGGASTELRIMSLDHRITPGATSDTETAIPDKAIVFGVTARVIETVTGPGLTGWRLGVADGPDRYGSGYGLGAGSFAHGVAGHPQTYYGATPLRLTAEGGAFEGGLVRLAVHIMTLTPPEIG